MHTDASPQPAAFLTIEADQLGPDAFAYARLRTTLADGRRADIAAPSRAALHGADLAAAVLRSGVRAPDDGFARRLIALRTAAEIRADRAANRVLAIFGIVFVLWFAIPVAIALIVGTRW